MDELRITLHSGIPTARKVLVVVLLMLVMLFAAPALSWILGGTVFDLAWLGWMLLILTECAGIAFLIGMFRYAAWLEGTVLVVRRFRTRRCDLAAAGNFTVRTTQWQGAARPELNALDPSTGKYLGVMLHKPATLTLLEPHALRALADAILAGNRPRPAAEHAGRIAHGLYTWADDPFAGMR